MAVNRGKQFEEVIRQSFERVSDTSVVRLHDQTTGYLGSTNHCDFIVYHKPLEYHIECKTIRGNTLSIYGKDEKHKYGNITNRQWEGLLEAQKVNGVVAGIICWWVDHDLTYFIPIWLLEDAREVGEKSINIRHPYCVAYWRRIDGKKKRVFFDYDMKEFFNGKIVTSGY